MEKVSSKGVTYTVVSCKLPGEFILRGIKRFSTPEGVKFKLMPFVALFQNSTLEWTFFNYHLPAYLEYGSGDIPRLGCSTDGAYVHRFLGGNRYGPGELLESWNVRA
jgi:hypothetical protein